MMPSGGSVGEGYGPMIVASRNIPRRGSAEDQDRRAGDDDDGLPGAQAVCSRCRTEVVPFDEIIPTVLEGKYEAGLIIHEGQLTFNKVGLHRIVDMGKWWRDLTGMPLPLGGNAIKRDLGPELITPAVMRCATAFSTPWIIAKKPCSTPCSSPAISMCSRPTSSSACM